MAYRSFREMRDDIDRIATTIRNESDEGFSDKEVNDLVATGISVVGYCLIQIAQELNEIKFGVTRKPPQGNLFTRTAPTHEPEGGQ